MACQVEGRGNQSVLPSQWCLVLSGTEKLPRSMQGRNQGLGVHPGEGVGRTDNVGLVPRLNTVLGSRQAGWAGRL